MSGAAADTFHEPNHSSLNEFSNRDVGDVSGRVFCNNNVSNTGVGFGVVDSHVGGSHNIVHTQHTPHSQCSHQLPAAIAHQVLPEQGDVQLRGSSHHGASDKGRSPDGTGTSWRTSTQDMDGCGGDCSHGGSERTTWTFSGAQDGTNQNAFAAAGGEDEHRIPQEGRSQEVRVVQYPNDTIKTMQQRTLMALYDKAPCGQDPVGFGMHASLSYEECVQKDPWVQATYQEGQCDPRLARFARWLEQQENPKYMGEATSSQPIPVETLIEKGYIKQNKLKKAVPSMTSEGSSAGSVTSSQWMQTTEMIKSLAEVVTSLKEGIKEMKSTPEPPRKGAKGEKSPRSTGSYEKVDLVVKQG